MKAFKLKRPLRDIKKASAIKGALSLASAQERQQQLAPPSTKVKLTIKAKPAANETDEHRKRRAMRRLWNKTMPSLHCSGCSFSAQCPQFRAGYECAFLPFLNSHEIQSEADLIFYAKELCREGITRAQTMLLMERLSGAKPDIDTTEALAHVFQQLMNLHERLTDANTVTAEVESTDRTIIGKLFGGLEQMLGRTKQVYSSPSVSLNHPGELLLEDAPKTPEHNLRKANPELIRDLSVIGIKNPEKSSVPVQEEL